MSFSCLEGDLPQNCLFRHSSPLERKPLVSDTVGLLRSTPEAGYMGRTLGQQKPRFDERANIFIIERSQTLAECRTLSRAHDRVFLDSTTSILLSGHYLSYISTP